MQHAASNAMLPHLETFARAAECRSFTAAGRMLGLSQAAVSQRIHQLEAELNTPLFLRRAGRVELTTAGCRLYEYANGIAEMHAQARATVTGLPVTATGHLNLAASSVPGECLLPHRLAEFRQHHPAIEVAVTVSDSKDVCDRVEGGTAQVGFVGDQVERPHLDFVPFASDRLTLVVPTGHRWWRRKQVTVAELLTQPFVIRERGSGSRGCLERALAMAGVGRSCLKVALEQGSNAAVRESVRQGSGLAVLSKLAVADDLSAGLLHAVNIVGLKLERNFYVVRDRRQALSGPANLFIGSLIPGSAA